MIAPLPLEATTLDGCVLRGHLWGGGQQWVVLIHDAESDHDLDRWNPLLPTLLELGVSICAFDQRGHGASDGEAPTGPSNGDIRTMIRFAKANGAEAVVVIAAGDAAWSVVQVVEDEPVDSVITLSTTAPTAIVDDLAVPRGPGIPKLFIVGSADERARKGTRLLHRAGIGWSLVVNLPTADHGTDLLDGEWLVHIREHVAAFIRERSYLARSGASEERGEG